MISAPWKLMHDYFNLILRAFKTAHIRTPFLYCNTWQALLFLSFLSSFLESPQAFLGRVHFVTMLWRWVLPIIISLYVSTTLHESIGKLDTRIHVGLVSIRSTNEVSSELEERDIMQVSATISFNRSSFSKWVWVDPCFLWPHIYDMKIVYRTQFTKMAQRAPAYSSQFPLLLTSHTTMAHLSQVSMLYTYYNFDSFSLMSFSCSRDPSRISHYLIFPYSPLVSDSFSEISCFCWRFWGILFKYFTDATQFGFFWCFSYC